MVNANLIFAGIEGGATHSIIVVVDGNGKCLATAEGPSTNHWLVGMDECCTRIKNLVDEVKTNANIRSDCALHGLGLCLSGCEQDETNTKLEQMLRERYPNLAETIFIGSDTIGSLSTACQNGGMILISGTGSNCLLVNPDGKAYQSGGWGHLIGDEGSAFWIASRAVKMIFDEDDWLVEPPHSTAVVRQLMFEHFGLKNRIDILPFCYSNFQKERYASLTARISRAAHDGDEFSIQLMKDAGYALGRFVSALSRNIDQELFSHPQGLQVVCSGSVFKSWTLLKDGFMKGIQRRSIKDKHIPKFTLLRLEVSSAYGALYRGSSKYGYDMPRDYDKNSKPMFTYDCPDHENKIQNVALTVPNGMSKASVPSSPIFSQGNESCSQDHIKSYCDSFSTGSSLLSLNGHGASVMNGSSLNGHGSVVTNGSSHQSINGHDTSITNDNSLNGHGASLINGSSLNGHSSSITNGSSINGHGSSHYS